MLTLTSKNTRTTLCRWSSVLIVNFENILTTFRSVSIDDFEHGNVFLDNYGKINDKS